MSMNVTKSPSELAGEMDQVLSDVEKAVEYELGWKAGSKDAQTVVSELTAERDKLIELNKTLISDIIDLDLENETLFVDYVDLANEVLTPEPKEVAKKSRIRVFLSRQLTFSEIEELTQDHNVLKGRLPNAGSLELFVRVGNGRRTVYVNGFVPSRVLYELIATALDAHFVNVHPKAVATFAEYNGNLKP